MSTYTGSELATKYAAYLIYKGTATPTEINQMTSPKLGYVFDVTANGTITNGNITVVAGDAIVYLAQGWTHMNNGSADQQIAALSAQVTQLISLIGNTDFSRFALKTEIPTVPTKVSAFQNDSGYLTQHQSLAAYQTKADSDAAYVGKLSSLDTTAADGTIVQYTGATTATLTKGHFYIYEAGTGWSEINLCNGEGDGIKQKNTLGTGTEGEIVFYTGTTTEDYITNNFYKYTNGEWGWVDIPSLTFAYNATSKTLSIEYGEATKEVNINNIIKDNTDGELDNTSENPIQNKVVAEALSDIEEVTDKLTTDLAGLHMEFDADNLQLVLLDSADQVIGTANLSTLAKDAMLEDVEIFSEAESGVSVSTPYLKFTFNTDAGTQPIRVPLTDFVINVTTDTVLSPVSTNPVQNKVIYEAIQALQTAINNITGTPDAALSTTSIKPVQNRVITNELNGVKDRVAALEGSGINYKYFKQVENLDTYQAEDGEIVEYIGSTNSKYKHGLTYKYIQGETIEVPRGYYYINLDNNHILVSSGETATGITQYMNVINKNGSYYTFFCKQSLSGNTPTDWNAIVQQELVNKLLVMKSDSGVKSWIKVVSITGEQISDYTWKFSTLTLEDGMVINREDITATSGSVASDILIDLNDSNSPDYYAIPDTPPIVSPTVINGCLFPTMQCGVGFNGSQKWASSEIKIDTSEWQHIKTTDTSTIESNIAALQTDKANEITSFTESSTRTNIASGDTVTTIWGKIKKWFTDLKAVAFSGSYNDLSNKPLSVESNKVKYTLSDGTTKLTLVQDSELSTVATTNDYCDLNHKPLSLDGNQLQFEQYTHNESDTAPIYIPCQVNSIQNGKLLMWNDNEKGIEDGSSADGSNLGVAFTPDTSSVRANIQSGDTIAQMAKIINSNFGFTYIKNSNFKFTSYITDANLYGVFFSGLGILIINGWFKLSTTDIPVHSDIIRFIGYTPIPAYPRFIDKYSNNIMNFRVGENGKGEWWILNYRSSTNTLYWEGLPTIVVIEKTT